MSYHRMSHHPKRLAALLTAAAFALIAATVSAAPASAATYYQQCDPQGTCLNMWNGGYNVATYFGYNAGNNNIAIHWLGNGIFELRDQATPYYCLGDANNDPNNPRLAAGDSCPSGGVADWGTRFQYAGTCANGYVYYRALHWPGKYLNFSDGNNHAVYLNGNTGRCMREWGFIGT